MRVLVVEDNDSKWSRLREVVEGALPPETLLVRACDIFEANLRIEEGGWDLLLLDMTLDLRRGGRSLPDYTGGLKVIAKMYYDDMLVPTLIVTGFDSFPTSRSNGDGVVLGLEAVEYEARRHLGDLLKGTIRHGPEGWDRILHFMLLELAGGGR